MIFFFQIKEYKELFGQQKEYVFTEINVYSAIKSSKSKIVFFLLVLLT